MARSRRILWAGLLLAGCFADSPTDGNAEGEASTGDPATTTASTMSSTSMDAGSMSGGATTQAPDESTTTAEPASSESGTASGESSSESSTGILDEPFCDAQPADVVLCYDFDDATPFNGGDRTENHGTIDVSDEHSVSEPQSMEVIAIGDPIDVTNVALNDTLAGVPTPFAGELSAMAWLETDCFPGGIGQERLLIALQFVDGGGFVLNFTIWVTSLSATLYVSDQSQGFPSEPYPLDLAPVTDEWFRVAIAFDATDDFATVTLGGESDVVAVDIITPTITGEIVGLAPYISVGTAMQPGQEGCTMWFDDVTVTLD